MDLLNSQMPLLLAILSFFIVIGPLIFFHELGHLLAALWNNIPVEEFGIGYPPRMLTLFEYNGTKYTLNWLPLGGFMRPKGEEDPDVLGGFSSAPKRARIAVLVAGPGANMIVAFVLLVIMFMLGAPGELPGARITAVAPDSPAEAAGLQTDDIITHADDEYIKNTATLITYITSQVVEAPDEAITLTIQRGSDTLELDVIPRTTPPEGQGPTGIQLEPVIEITKYGLFSAMGSAVDEMWTYAKAMVEIPAAVIRGDIAARFLRPVSVVGISQIGGQALNASVDQQQAWPILRIAAAISIALAITNLLPIPALDGGRILFILIEAVRGRRIDPQREMMVHLVSFAILLTVMLVFVYLDIVDPLIVP